MSSSTFRSFERISALSLERYEDAFAELEKAALERVHAKLLAAKQAVLVATADGRGWQLVTLKKLKPTQRELLLKQVYASEEDEQLGFFTRMRERMDKAGLKPSTVEIRFKNLTVQGKQLVKPDVAPSGGGLAAKLKGLRPGAGNDSVRPHNLIDGVNGVLRPGRLTLLLGTPGSGRSLLMKSLSGRLRGEKSLKVTADELTYNGEGLDKFVPERSAAYISQLDEHYGELTVRETLEFAARVQGGMTDLVAELEKKEKELGITPDPEVASFYAALTAPGKKSLRVDVVLRTLGLEHVADTLVGNAMLRGISGGQKKRVTAGEMLVGPGRALFADDISTGLDSATTYSVVAALRRVAAFRQATQLVALLQPTPETISLFDDVIALSAGVIIYHGPTDGILPFFQSLGFACPPRRAMADFLQEVPTMGDQSKYWSGKGEEYEFVGAKQIAEAFYASTPAGQETMRELGAPFAKSQAEMGDVSALVRQTYGAPLGMLTTACLRRGLLLTKSAVIKIQMGRFMQNVIMALCVGTLFLSTPTGLENGELSNLASSLANANYLLGVLFFSIMTFLVAPFADSALMVEALPVWWKQKNAKFYPAFCFALQLLLMRLPFVFVESWVWTLMVYFMVGFYTSARLLAFWGILFGIGVFSLTLWLAIAALMRNVAAASAVQATFLLLFVVTSGFVLAKPAIPGGWNGMYWSNPFQYAISGLANNEMTSPAWSQEVSPGQTIGQLALYSRGIHNSYVYVWIAIFVVGGACAVLNFAGLVYLLAKLDAPKGRVVISEEAYESNLVSREGASRKGGMAGSAKGSQENFVKVDVSKLDGAGGSALPFTPLTMTFKDVQYSVPYPKDATRPEDDTTEGTHAGRLLLLKGITGSFRPGVLTALMGSSGAGKTTLMDVLADRKTGGTITGDVRLNGFPKEPRAFARVMGYCEQTDIHVPYTTVQEALQFSAALRLPSDVPKERAKAFVQEVMDLVELTSIRNSSVGLPGGGLSVEQRKRLTIAVELVANPSIVFMDEPTSGLDARAAALVMRAVKNTVATGRAVVCTIHQPSMEIFEAFDELLLLKRGGMTIFHGPIGDEAANLIQYFKGYSGVADIAPGVNPANWMLDVTSAEAEHASGHDFAAAYRTSEAAKAVDELVEKCSTPAPGEAPLRYEDMHVASQLRQMQELIKRNNKEMLRNLTYNAIRGVVALFCSIVFATLFRGQGDNVETSGGILNVAGAMYSASIFIGVIFCFMAQDPAGLRRSVYYREHSAGIYGPVPYWFAEFGAEVPWLAVISIFYSIIVYFSIGFASDAGKFFWFVAQIFLNVNVYTAFGLLAVHVTPNLQLSNAFAGFFFSFFNLFCGFMKPQPAIPAGWIWAYWLDPTSYTLYGLIVNQLGDVTSLTQIAGGQAVPVNAFVESYFGFKHSFQWYTILVLVGFVFFFRALALLALSKLNFQTR